MTSRQRVLAALARQPTDRVPFAWGFGPTSESSAELEAAFAREGIAWEKLRRAADDVVSVSPTYTGPNQWPGEPEYMALWGIRTRRVSYGAGAYDEIAHSPLAGMESPDELDRHRWPRVEDFNYDELNAQLAAGDPDATKALRLNAGNPFEIYCWMTGLEEAMANLVVAPELVTAALDRINRFFIERSARCAAALQRPVDLLFCADDLGSQQGLLLSREMYRALLQPHHRLLFSELKAAAPEARILFHTDGAVFDILPDLLDAGIDILEAVQTEAAGMEPERLKSTYGDRLAFHGAISVQQWLPHGTTDQVRHECSRLLRVFGTGGGYIAAPSHAVQAGTPAANVRAMLETILGPDVFAASRLHP
ncbi:uroporphyrinogen decarboxylase family protein [Nibricoccus sp. IMCC34717]|uniref:uroporphyrinogen decarboxylase family protein n=1 Tax=Nibricoccus sp. IMCC34717 TaxID=3034021 RepID=UPI0038504D12